MPLASTLRRVISATAFAAWVLVAAPTISLDPSGEGEPAALELFGTSEAEAGPCPADMVSIGGSFCIDQYEARTVEVALPKPGTKGRPRVLRDHSPYKPVTGLEVMAVSAKGKVPQAHISRDEADRACRNAGKRLCTDEEWVQACKGKKPTLYPYGEDHVEGRCNDKGVSSFNLLYGPGNNQPPEQGAYTMEHMNDPRLNQMKGTVARGGEFKRCRNAYKLYDMVGNLHEWTSASSGTFRGGYYLDTHINGQGCDYKTGAHNARYHDYSTGFRCCQGGLEQQRVDREERARRDAEKAKLDAERAKLAKADAKDRDERKQKKGSDKPDERAKKKQGSARNAKKEPAR
jgi:formylglycine-generating enzyme